jgi:high-affinity iron transporter
MISLGVACQTRTIEPFVAEGKRIYKERCVACHGPLGKGDGYVEFNPPVADLTSKRVQKRLDAELFRTIHQGRPNTAMGSWRLALSDEEILAVIQHVRTLGTSAVHF